MRVNGLDTPWGRDDLVAVARLGRRRRAPAQGRVPRGGVAALDILAAHGAPESLAVWCMVETPRGVLAAAAIAAASPRVGALVVGTSDLAKELGARPTRDRLPLATSLGLVVLAARAHGLVALDGVHLDLDDEDGFIAACRQGRDMGFDGKTLIHPKQIAAANAAFGPSAEEIAGARRVIDVHDAAAAAGKGVAVLDGRLIENLHAAEARRVVALAEAIGALESAATTGGVNAAPRSKPRHQWQGADHAEAIAHHDRGGCPRSRRDRRSRSGRRACRGRRGRRGRRDSGQAAGSRTTPPAWPRSRRATTRGRSPCSTTSVERDGKNADAYNWLAYATRKNGDPAASIPIYEKALAIDPKHRGAHEYIGEAYLMLGDVAKAKRHLAALDSLCCLPVRGVPGSQEGGPGVRKAGQEVVGRAPASSRPRDTALGPCRILDEA